MDDRARAEQLFRFGLGLARTGHASAAALLWQLANDAGPDSGRSAAARVLLDGGHASAALDCLEAGARTHGWEPRTRYLRAVAAGRAGLLEDGVGFARELTAYPDHRANALLLIADLLLESGDLAGARLAGETAVREQPESAQALLALARVARREEMSEEEMDLLHRARRLDPEDLAVRTAYGIALVEEGRRSEGQRELASVVAKRPGDPVATRALLGSSFASRGGWLLALSTYFGIPGLSVLAAWLRKVPAQRLLHVYVAAQFALVLCIRVVDNVRTDRSVAAIKKHAGRRLRHGQPLLPTLRPLRWLVAAIVAGLWASLIGVSTLFVTDPPMAQRVVMFLVLGTPGWSGVVVSLRMWKRRRGQLERGEPRRFDPSTCRCHRVATLGGRRADAYVQRHLAFESSIDPGRIDQYRCDLLGTRWLRFSELTALQAETLPVALRLRDDPEAATARVFPGLPGSEGTPRRT